MKKLLITTILICTIQVTHSMSPKELLPLLQHTAVLYKQTEIIPQKQLIKLVHKYSTNHGDYELSLIKIKLKNLSNSFIIWVNAIYKFAENPHAYFSFSPKQGESFNKAIQAAQKNIKKQGPAIQKAFTLCMAFISCIDAVYKTTNEQEIINYIEVLRLNMLQALIANAQKQAFSFFSDHVYGRQFT